MATDTVTWKVRFEGRVQGVGFRYTVMDLSRGFEVCGWVKNLSDGAVEMLASGEKGEVEDFIREIVEESVVAGNIRAHYQEDASAERVEPGFRIAK